MFAITLTEKGGDQRRLDFDKAEITIGRVQGNDVVLPKGNVSKRHARIVLKDGKFIIVDLKSTNGTYVNGRKITSPLVVKHTDKIFIGDFILAVEEGAGQAVAASAPQAPPQAMAPPPQAPPPSAPPQVMAPPPSQPERPRAPSAPPPIAPPRQPSSVPDPAAMGAPSPAPDAGQGMPMGNPQPVAPPAPQRSPEPSVPPPLAAPTPQRMDSQPAPPPVAPPRMERPSQPPPMAPAPLAEPAPSAPAHTPAAAPSAAPFAPSEPIAPPAAPPAASAPAASKPRLVGAGAGARGPSVSGKVNVALSPEVRQRLEMQDQVLQRVVRELQLDSIALERLGDEDLWQRAEGAIVDVVDNMEASGELPKGVDQDQLIKETLNEALGLGPLEDLLADDTTEEILVDRIDRIIISRSGNRTGAGTAFSSEEVFRRVVERLLAPAGIALSDDEPFVNVRLRDGSRLTVAMPSVSAMGACLVLNKPVNRADDLRSLSARGILSTEASNFLTACVQGGRNIIVSGSAGAAKDLVLGALASAAGSNERIASVETVSSLKLSREHWIALETRPGDADRAELLRGAMRLLPDRVVMPDVAGREASALMQVMAGSLEGTLLSVAAASSRGALDRFVQHATLDGQNVSATRSLLGACVDVVVHLRGSSAQSRIEGIYDVSDSDKGFSLTAIFEDRGDGQASATGHKPTFLKEFEARGVEFDASQLGG